MLTNHPLVIILILSFLFGAWSLREGEFGKVVASIVVGFLCGLSIYFNLLSGQPLW